MTKQHIPSISQNIGESIVASQEAYELIADIGEFTIDQFLDDELLKEIPVVGWIIQAKKLYNSISDRILLAKIAKFLLALHEHTRDQSNELLDDLENSQKERRKIGETVLIALDKLDDLDKPELVARCFACYLNGLLSIREFSQLVDSVIKCHASDLEWFYIPYPRINISPSYQRLVTSGLARLKITQSFSPMHGASHMTPEFEMSDLGNLLQDIISGRLARRPDAAQRRKMNLRQHVEQETSEPFGSQS